MTGFYWVFVKIPRWDRVWTSFWKFRGFYWVFFFNWVVPSLTGLCWAAVGYGLSLFSVRLAWNVFLFSFCFFWLVGWLGLIGLDWVGPGLTGWECVLLENGPRPTDGRDLKKGSTVDLYSLLMPSVRRIDWTKTVPMKGLRAGDLSNDGGFYWPAPPLKKKHPQNHLRQNRKELLLLLLLLLLLSLFWIVFYSFFFSHCLRAAAIFQGPFEMKWIFLFEKKTQKKKRKKRKWTKSKEKGNDGFCGPNRLRQWATAPNGSIIENASSN